MGQSRSRCQWLHCWAHTVFSSLGNCRLWGFKCSVWNGQDFCIFPKILIPNELSRLKHSTPFFSLLPLPMLISIKWKRCKKKVQLPFISTRWQILAHLDGAKAWVLAPCVGFPPAQETLSLTLLQSQDSAAQISAAMQVSHSSEHHPRPPLQSRGQTHAFRGNSSTLIKNPKINKLWVNPILPFPLSMAGRTGSDEDVSIQNGGSDLPYTKAEKIAFPEGQNDILIHIAQGRGGGDLSGVTLPWMWVLCGEFSGLQGERQEGVTKGKSDLTLKPQCRTTQVSCMCPAPAPFSVSISLPLFQRVNFKCKLSLFAPFWSLSLFVRT